MPKYNTFRIPSPFQPISSYEIVQNFVHIFLKIKKNIYAGICNILFIN